MNVFRNISRQLVGASVAVAVISMTFAPVLAQPVRDRVLSRTRVVETNACATLSVEFNFPVRLVSYFPESRGDHVRINLKPIDARRTDFKIGAREELRAPSSRVAGIQEIQFESDNSAGSILTITFNRRVYFDISQGKDFRSIDIKIADKEITASCNGKAPGLRNGPDVSGSGASSDAQSTLHSVPDTIDSNAAYALNLTSQQPEFNAKQFPVLPEFKQYALYTARYEENGVVWNRLRLGFFKTRTEADNVAKAVKANYPDAWVARTSRTERESVYQQWLTQRKNQARNDIFVEAPPAPMAPAGQTAEQPIKERLPAPVSPATSSSAPTSSDAETLLAEAKDLISSGDFARAIQLLTKLTSMEPSQSTPEARELLGLAREKNGQLAHAKAEYEEYLRAYPDGEEAPRVRQRLASLLTAGKDASPELREGKSAGVGAFAKRLTASFSQYYQRDESKITLELPDATPDPDKDVNRNALISSLDMTASVSNDRVNAALRVSGSHTKDFIEGGRGDFGSISALYLDLADSVSGLSARLGRQTRSTGGVLGRFDGGRLSFDASDHIRINLVGGSPVLRSRDLFVDKERYFAGASVDVNQVVDGLDTTFFFIHQEADGLIDRQAAGVEFRYVDDNRTAFGLIDYDVFYDSLNFALFNGSWRLEDNTTFNVSFDYRYAPALMTINALQGQGVETIEELRALYNDDDIYFFAEERAARSRTGTFSISHPFNDKFQINSDVTITSTSATNDAGGVMGQPSTGVEKFYSLQLLGNSLFKAGDLVILGFRYDDMSTSNRYIVDLNTRYPVTKQFRVNPRFRVAYREITASGQTEITYKPSLRLNYIPKRFLNLELEGGGEWSTTEAPLSTERTLGYYVIAGYRLDF